MEFFSLISFIVGAGLGYALRKPKPFDTSVLESKITELETQNQIIDKENTTLKQEKRDLESDKRSLDIDNATLKADYENIQNTMRDWEKTKQEFMQHAENASLKATQDLLEKNKNARADDKKELETKVQKTTADLNKKYDTVTSTLHHVDEQVKQQQSTVNTIEKALSNPLEVGTHLEINLENTLQAFDLQSGIDYHMQMSSDDGANRPDAVIFLPNDSALVIDAKASKFFWHLAEAEQQNDTDDIATAYAKLKSAMNTHLKSLSLKPYKDSVLKELQKNNPNIVKENISLCMFVGSDVHIGKIDNADNQFILNASNKGISVVAKSGLYALISLASRKIDLQRQIGNNRLIIKELETLIDRIAILSTHGEKVTKGLKNATDNWDKLVTSFDRRIIPSGRKIQGLGVAKDKNIKYLDNNKNKDFLEAEVIPPNALPDESDS